MLVPLATFAVDNGTACEIYVKAQEDEISTAIFGTMFFQQFVAYYENGGNPQSAQRQNLTLALSPTAAMPQSYVGIAATTQTANLFAYSGTSIPLLVNVTSMTTMVQAEYGYQGLADFKLSINDSVLYTFINDLYNYPGVDGYFDTTDYDFSDNF